MKKKCLLWFSFPVVNCSCKGPSQRHWISPWMKNETLCFDDKAFQYSEQTFVGKKPWQEAITSKRHQWGCHLTSRPCLAQNPFEADSGDPADTRVRWDKTVSQRTRINKKDRSFFTLSMTDADDCQIIFLWLLSPGKIKGRNYSVLIKKKLYHDHL